VLLTKQGTHLDPALSQAVEEEPSSVDVWSDDGAGDGADDGPDELNQTAPLPAAVPVTPPDKKQKPQESRRHVAAQPVTDSYDANPSPLILDAVCFSAANCQSSSHGSLSLCHGAWYGSKTMSVRRAKPRRGVLIEFRDD